MLYKVPEEIKDELKKPFGKLVLDSELSREVLLSSAFADNSSLKVSVGDRTTERIQIFGFKSDLEIVDGYEQRKPFQTKRLWENSYRRILKVANPAGFISSESLSALKDSLKILLESSSLLSIRIEIEGEEDLLALPVFAIFPPGTFVFYGQPNLGMVLVRLENELAEKSKSILRRIGVEI